MMTDETLRLYAKRLANYCDAKFQTFDEENAFNLLKQLAQEAVECDAKQKVVANREIDAKVAGEIRAALRAVEKEILREILH